MEKEQKGGEDGSRSQSKKAGLPTSRGGGTIPHLNSGSVTCANDRPVSRPWDRERKRGSGAKSCFVAPMKKKGKRSGRTDEKHHSKETVNKFKE